MTEYMCLNFFLQSKLLMNLTMSDSTHGSPTAENCRARYRARAVREALSMAQWVKK